jgi:hypothetical protein
VIVQILVAQAQCEHALLQHVGDAMGDAFAIAWITQHASGTLEQAQAPLQLPQQQHAAIAGHVSAAELGFDLAPLKRREMQRRRVTIWHWRNPRKISSRQLI